ncbi:MAG: hypothetical protein QE271_00770 [Bacteriovoracaceae bacterium]|nr:hypothetical protein [Bacteriovoracaceae bacterium]
MNFLLSIEAAIAWSQSQFSGLPWRAPNRTLYSTAVSEFMLQQTVVGTVLKKFPSFMKTFPSWNDLANADEAQVLKEWEGLGYYRRARLLNKLARHVVHETSDGELPLEEKRLLDFPGIGPYTANAIRGIGGDQPALALDTNLQRVLSRFFGVENSFTTEDMEKYWPNYFLQRKFSYRHFLEAMMDVGRIFCKERSADCQVCPLKKHCQAQKNKGPLTFGQKKKKKKESIVIELIRVFIKSSEGMYFYQKNNQEWLSGQWETLVFTNGLDQENLFSQYPRIQDSALKDFLKKKNLKPVANYSSTITKYKFKNDVYVLNWEEVCTLGKFKKEKIFERLVFYSSAKLHGLHLSSATMKGLSRIKKGDIKK